MDVERLRPSVRADRWWSGQCDHATDPSGLQGGVPALRHRLWNGTGRHLHGADAGTWRHLPPSAGLAGCLSIRGRAIMAKPPLIETAETIRLRAATGRVRTAQRRIHWDRVGITVVTHTLLLLLCAFAIAPLA